MTFANLDVEVTLSKDEDGGYTASIVPSTFKVGWAVTDPEGHAVQVGPVIEMQAVADILE